MNKEDKDILKALTYADVSLVGNTSVNLTPLAQMAGVTKDEAMSILRKLHKGGYLKDFTEGSGGEVVFICLDVKGQRAGHGLEE